MRLSGQVMRAQVRSIHYFVFQIFPGFSLVKITQLIYKYDFRDTRPFGLIEKAIQKKYVQCHLFSQWCRNSCYFYLFSVFLKMPKIFRLPKFWNDRVFRHQKLLSHLTYVEFDNCEDTSANTYTIYTCLITEIHLLQS